MISHFQIGDRCEGENGTYISVARFFLLISSVGKRGADPVFLVLQLLISLENKSGSDATFRLPKLKNYCKGGQGRKVQNHIAGWDGGQTI